MTENVFYGRAWLDRLKFPVAIFPLVAYPFTGDLSEVEDSHQRAAADDVADEGGQHEAEKVGEPGNGSDIDKVEDIDRACDDVREAAQRDDIGNDDDDVHLRAISGGQQPDHEGDQPAGEDAAHDSEAEIAAQGMTGHVDECLMDRGREDGRVRQDEGD